jgi:hypothetical protein
LVLATTFPLKKSSLLLLSNQTRFRFREKERKKESAEKKKKKKKDGRSVGALLFFLSSGGQTKEKEREHANDFGGGVGGVSKLSRIWISRLC